MSRPSAAPPALAGVRRLVVKVGSALLVGDGGDLRGAWLDALAADVAALRTRGTQVLLVSSGAIAVGRKMLGLARGPRNRALRLEESQAAAAVGQIRLAHAWQEGLGRHQVPVAQVLLTTEDTESRRRALNARSTLATLLRLGVCPVINENDTVATEEIRFGDNDRLAARVAQVVAADACVLLSDVDGLYTADPATDGGARHVPRIDSITAEVESWAGRPRTDDGSGGMVTKLDAARIATGAGCRLAIADGRHPHALSALDAGGRATWFAAHEAPRSARKHWIRAALNPVGVVVVDDGAARALAAGKSLLPAGVVSVSGDFARGDAVIVRDRAGAELARGLAAYDAGEARRIAGHRSSEIETLVGYRGREEMIHRDDLVIGPAPEDQGEGM